MEARRFESGRMQARFMMRSSAVWKMLIELNLNSSRGRRGICLDKRFVKSICVNLKK